MPIDFTLGGWIISAGLVASLAGALCWTAYTCRALLRVFHTFLQAVLGREETNKTADIECGAASSGPAPGCGNKFHNKVFQPFLHEGLLLQCRGSGRLYNLGLDNNAHQVDNVDQRGDDNNAHQLDNVDQRGDDNNAHQLDNVDQRGDDVENEFEIEEILNRRLKRGKVEYLVKWRGYESPEDQTWERGSTLMASGEEEFVQGFETKQRMYI